MAVYRSRHAADKQPPERSATCRTEREHLDSDLPVPAVLPRRVPGAALTAAQQGRFGWFDTDSKADS